MNDKVKMCGGCGNHQGTACAVHPGFYDSRAAACPQFDPNVPDQVIEDYGHETEKKTDSELSGGF